MNILGKRYYYFLFSLILIVPGLIVMAIYGMPLAIDFTGGSYLEVQFASGKAPDPAQAIALYNELGITDVQANTTKSSSSIASDDILVLRSTFIDDNVRADIVTKMSERFNDTLTVRNFNSVGPTIGAEVTNRALLALLVAALGVIIFITFSFQKIENPFRYGICAIIAMAHDVLVVISLSAIGGHFFGWQIDSLFLTAMLTVIGFSVQDKIVVFDRIRENSGIYRKLPFEKLANHSIIQTLQRSINTQLMTSEFMLLALALFGGVTLREFCVILLVGLASGTYSSIFIAAPILVVWENKEWKHWFKRGQATEA